MKLRIAEELFVMVNDDDGEVLELSEFEQDSIWGFGLKWKEICYQKVQEN